MPGEAVVPNPNPIVSSGPDGVVEIGIAVRGPGCGGRGAGGDGIEGRAHARRKKARMQNILAIVQMIEP